MDRRRQIALAACVLATGLGAGYFVQRDVQTPRMSVTAIEPTPDPVRIEPVAAGPETPEVLVPAQSLARLQPAEPAPTADCSPDLQLMPAAHAVISVTLIAPCAPEARVVIKHAGLVVTGKTSVNGVMMMDLPAMVPQAVVETQVAGETIRAELAMPEAARLQRFAVQWLDKDAFQLNAFENGADYGGAGHVSVENPHRPSPGMVQGGGYMLQIGDAEADLPMQAEVYTYPATGHAELVVEAAVSETTCGRELLGETVLSRNGLTEVEDLSLAMPDCTGIGDIVVLKNPVAEMKLAAQ